MLQSSCICIARRGDLFVWRASNTDNASVRKTVGEHGSKESLTKIDACLSASALLYSWYSASLWQNWQSVLHHWDTG